jgi:PAP2 superfamily
MKTTQKSKNSPSLIATSVMLAFLAFLESTARADAVTDWNAHLEQAVFATAQPIPAQARSAAIVHAAIFDAVNGIARRYTPYFVTEAAPLGARQEAAAVQAAYTALKAIYPAHTATLDAQLAQSLAAIPGHQGKSVSIERGRAWGEYVAHQILAWRSTDGFSTPPPPYFGGGAPGIWRSVPTPTNPDGTLPVVFPQLATLLPFAMSSPAQFRPGPPYAATLAEALASPAYAADVNEVKAIGRFDSPLRTPDQTQLALLWQAVGPIDENRIARSVAPASHSLVQNARLFALLNITVSDALVIGFDSKFAYNLWRPHHAIRLADTDGNPATEADPAWSALFIAPRFQEYVSNHSTITGSFMHLLSHELGDEHTFTLSSPNFPAFTWTFDRFSAASAQVKEARIWGGIHFRTACDVGQELGVALAEYVLENFLTPIHQP